MGIRVSHDHIEISSLFARFADLLDEARYDDIGTIYTDDVVAHSPQGGELRGIEEVRAFLHGSHVDGVRTQHLPTGVVVDVDGDRAKASANQLTYFYREGEPPFRTGSVRVTWEAVRTPAGWRVREARIAVVWIRDGLATTAG
jgi:ketosteroid isomerase-like protein